MESKAESNDGNEQRKIDVNERSERRNAPNVLPNRQKKPLDSSVKFWAGDWFLPKVGFNYLVPENSAEHTIRAGQIGKCVGVRVSQFGMSWALIQFREPIEPRVESNPPMWIRTQFLTDDVCDHNWVNVEGTQWVSECTRCGATK